MTFNGYRGFDTTNMVSIPQGPPAEVESGLLLGLDVGGTKLAAGVVDRSGRVLASVRRPTPTADPAAAISELITAGRAAIDQVDGLIVAGGIACGGPLDISRGLVLSPPNLPGWDAVPLVDVLQAEFGIPLTMDNDANAAAIASCRWGPTAGAQDLVYLTVSSGIGSGIITGGRVVRGVDGNAGEAGHMPVRWQGRPCLCGQRGCLEAYSSGNSIARRAAEAVAAGESSTLANASSITAADVAAAARSGDRLARRVWSEAVDMLGMAVATLINVFEPQAVILGGGVTEAGRMLLDDVRMIGTRDALSAAGRQTEVMITPFGRDIGVMAAACLSAQKMSPMAVGMSS